MILPMDSALWQRVVAEDYRVPSDHPLQELTVELTGMLGTADPHRRDDIAATILLTWISRGVYDDLLGGLGDGICAGLEVGLGEQDTDSVFRRSFSALVLAGCIERAATHHVLPDAAVERWADRVASWLVRERDLRGSVPGKGWAHAVAHGADALGALAQVGSLGAEELGVLLDVLADRLLVETPERFTHGEDDRLARAALDVVRRDLVDTAAVESWLQRLAGALDPPPDPLHPGFAVAGNVESFLRALQLQLALTARPPVCRADVLLLILDVLRASNAAYLR